MTFIKWPAGSFVCFGAGVKPFLVILTRGQHDALRNMVDLHHRRGDWASRRPDILSSIFEPGVEDVIPADNLKLMEQAALTYVGPHQVELRGMCAAITMGRSVSKDKGQAGGMDIDGGGEPAPLDPPPPVKPAPASMNPLYADVDEPVSVA